MIDNDEQFRNTLEYLTKWANALEGMRRHADETEPNFLSQASRGQSPKFARDWTNRAFISNVLSFPPLTPP